MSIDSETETSSSADQAHAIGIEAYVYLYPLMTMEISRGQQTNHSPFTGDHRRCTKNRRLRFRSG